MRNEREDCHRNSRWSQATERLIDTGDRVRTQSFNGCADQVAKLYPSL